MKNKEIVVSLVNENQNNNFHVISIGNHSLIMIIHHAWAKVNENLLYFKVSNSLKKYLLFFQEKVSNF